LDACYKTVFMLGFHLSRWNTALDGLWNDINYS